jgi:glycosyltransferase involved in cell wall biosynthesis
MRVLQVHNYYQQWGGEDEQTEHELRLLKSHNHTVQLYSRHNDEIKNYGFIRKGMLFFETTWSHRSYRELREIIITFKPEIVHFQNFFPLISPSAYYACSSLNVPCVQTLHNYRMMCPMGNLVRDGIPCEECRSHSLLKSIQYACYRNSRIQSASVAFMLKVHRLLKTWTQNIDGFIAVSEFSRRKFVEAGIPSHAIEVRPNFLNGDPGLGEGMRDHAIFVGRLEQQKGIQILLQAWRQLPHIPLIVIGKGPLGSWASNYVRKNNLRHITLVGFVPFDEVLEYLKRSLFLVMPSTWYETFGRTIIEAFATSTPVIASRLGAMAELVTDMRNGLLFNPGDADDLACKAQYLASHPLEIDRLGKAARSEFNDKYTSQAAHSRLIEIYDKVISTKKTCNA